ncbi:hypothetical protein [Phyllobacterium zundukense]|uniref:Uncharacterized protein n=1 Tax=Phyllobacterium zundukense TaxID=1867719 RepID=A0ACD4CZG9_9HYPH|nr:hypothetical protein [Phyllobacterium zundukense]UXN58954.1 hypothetical protein N8E88_08625 [Phyllobacterium zundukense]
MFAFSVFTHLSERATKKNLAAIRNHMKVGALACITIRPVEYWSHVHGSEPQDWLEARWNAHREEGFTFQPHQQRELVDGDITYGDTSMTIEWLMSVADGFELAAVDRSSDDEYQRYVFLRAIPFEESVSRPTRSAILHRRPAPGQLVHETRTVDLVRTVLSRLKSRVGM